MNSIILCTVISWITLNQQPWDMLETQRIFSWSVPEIAGYSACFTRDGVPLTVSGDGITPGWGSFDSLTVRSPLEAGVWGSGRWEMDFASFSLPESTFESEIGLIENTDSRNRYSAALRRPILSDIRADLSIAREDTAGYQRMVLKMGGVSLGATGWDGESRGYALWTGLNMNDLTGRLTFGHLRSGGRYWELLGSLNTSVEWADIMTAAAATLDDDTLFGLQGHVRLQAPVAGSRLVLRADIIDDQGEVSAGGSAGLLFTPWILKMQAGVAAQPGEDPRFVGLAGLGPMEIFVEGDDEGIYPGIQASYNSHYGILQAGCTKLDDSLTFAGTALPCIRWGEEGRLYGGVSWKVVDTDTTTVGEMDLESSFTLGSFAFIFAVEDIVDEWRSYSFGITWMFNDRREFAEMEDRE